MRNYTRLLLTAFIAAAAVSSGLAADAKAPAWQLKNLQGKDVSFADFEGKVVVLDFWATWCPPCRQEIPHFVELQKKYAEKGLVIVGVSLDEGGVAGVKSFAEKYGINYPVVMGDQQIVMDYGGIEGIPTTFIIDRKGQIVSKHVGYTDQATFEKEIQPLL